MIGSGSGVCHGPGCTRDRDAKAGFFCSPECSRAWHANLTAALGAVSTEEAGRNLREALRGISAMAGTTGMAVASLGITGISARAVEVEQLNARLRAAFPDCADAAVAEAQRRAHTSFATYAQEVESMWIDPPDFATAGATKQQVASKDPQVAHSGWLGRLFNRWRRE